MKKYKLNIKIIKMVYLFLVGHLNFLLPVPL